MCNIALGLHLILSATTAEKKIDASQKRINKIKAFGKLAQSRSRAFPETIAPHRRCTDWLASGHNCTLMLGLESTLPETLSSE